MPLCPAREALLAVHGLHIPRSRITLPSVSFLICRADFVRTLFCAAPCYLPKLGCVPAGEWQ